MQALLDEIIFVLNSFSDFFQFQLTFRTLGDWLFFFMPFYVFGEFPRYVLPAFYLFYAKIFGKLKDDTEEKKRFMARKPSISVLLVGLNEEASIANAIRSLLEANYPNMEIIVVDDGSTDCMYQIAKEFADKGQVKLYKNSAATGRAGRPMASNLALHVAKNEFILSVDSDTSFDRDMLLHMIGPFYNPKVGVVAGNLKIRNVGTNCITDCQAIEYFQSIGVWKRWLNLLNMNMMASGAFGAFRRQALIESGGWDPELSEDADVSLKLKKSGYDVVFAPEAIAMTDAPDNLKQLTKQRYRWERGMLRTYFHKHGDLLKFWRFDWRNAVELSLDYFFLVVLTLLYFVYIIYMVGFYFRTLIFVWIVCYFVHALTAFLMTAVSLVFSERRKQEWTLLLVSFVYPFYSSYFRWVRFVSLVLETLRIYYENNFMPPSAWKNAPKW